VLTICAPRGLASKARDLRGSETLDTKRLLGCTEVPPRETGTFDENVAIYGKQDLRSTMQAFWITQRIDSNFAALHLSN
jgi:hypothetical protein